MSDNFSIFDALTSLRKVLRSTEVDGVQTIHTNTDVATVAIPTALLFGQTVVVTAGTSVPLGVGTAESAIVIAAPVTNTGDIYVGDDTVTSANGYVLEPGQSVVVSISDISLIHIDADVDGEGASFVGS